MRKYLTVVLAAMAAGGLALAQGGLTVWTTFNDRPLEWLQLQVAEFAATFGVEAEVIRLDLGDLQQQMLLGAEQGEAADVLVGIPHDQIGNMAAGGVLADMSTFATDDFLNDFGEQARLAYTASGKLLGLPMFVVGPALIVNTDLVPEIPETYEQMIELAKELTTDETWGFMCDCLRNFYFAYNWLHSTGGFVFERGPDGDLLADTLGVANEGAIRGAEHLKALHYEHELIPAGANYEVVNGLFASGDLAMIYNGPWAISQYLEAGIDLVVVPMPRFADGTVASGFMNVEGVLMNQFSANRTDAANLAKWLARADAQVSLAEHSGRIPTSTGALAAVADLAIIAGYGQALLYAEPLPNIPEMGTVWGPMGSALGDIFESEDSNVSEILQNAQDEILGN